MRALSRKSGSGLSVGDLLTGAGIADAMTGVDVVVHLSTGRRDVDQAKTAISAGKNAGVAHFVLISIVGIEKIPLGYYKGKVQIEKYLAASGLPFTILRATQFHQFVEAIFLAQKFSPVIFAPRFSFQPIAVEEVAQRLVGLAGAAPAGRVSDIGGPERRTARELAEEWKSRVRSRRAICNLRLPGKTVAGFAGGHNLVPGESFGHTTFSEYLDANY